MRTASSVSPRVSGNPGAVHGDALGTGAHALANPDGAAAANTSLALATAIATGRAGRSGDVTARAIAAGLGVEVSTFRAAMDSFRSMDGSSCDGQ